VKINLSGCCSYDSKGIPVKYGELNRRLSFYFTFTFASKIDSPI
jgi:hypothetical protein